MPSLSSLPRNAMSHHIIGLPSIHLSSLPPVSFYNRSYLTKKLHTGQHSLSIPCFHLKRWTWLEEKVKVYCLVPVIFNLNWPISFSRQAHYFLLVILVSHLPGWSFYSFSSVIHPPTSLFPYSFTAGNFAFHFPDKIKTEEYFHKLSPLHVPCIYASFFFIALPPSNILYSLCNLFIAYYSLYCCHYKFQVHTIFVFWLLCAYII